MKFLVKKQQIDCIERDKLADGQIAFVSFRFVFDNEWEGLYKVVQFMQGENTYNISLGVDGYSCKMPSELQAGCAEMSLFGYAPDDETALRATTAPIKLRIEQSGFSSSGSEIVPPTPDLYQQLIAKIDEKIASVHDGADGASAYEIAVENGYTGTEAEWLTSLKGQKGERGEKGEKGDTGEQGLQGIQGEKGEKGDTGAAGKDGMNGTDGRDGANGFSPTVIVTETSTGATITATDKNGTTTATIKNGTSGETASWGDYTPGCEEGESAKYCTAKLVTVTGKQTWQVLPSISTVSHNALDIVPDGLFVLDLSPDVDALKASAHTHDNKSVLDDIDATKWSVIKNMRHSHNNMAILNSLSPADLQHIQALQNVIGELTVLHSNFDDTCSTKAVYVNATAGSDAQDGSTAAKALLTMSRALQFTQYAKKAVIYLAAGTYPIPDKTLTLLGRDVRIYGNAAATTTIQGNFVCENGFLHLSKVTIDNTDSDTANTSTTAILAQYNGTVRISDCVVNANSKNAVGVSDISNICCSGTEFKGNAQYAVYVTGQGDAKIYSCTNSTTKGIYSGANSMVRITQSKTFAVSKTAITSADMDANLINFAASGVKSGKFTANGMKRTAASDDAVATLVTNGWTVSGLTKEG